MYNESCFSHEVKLITVSVFIVCYWHNSHGKEMSMVKKAIDKKNIPVYGIAIGEEFVNKKEKIENNFYFISDMSDQQTQLSDVQWPP